VLVRSAWLVGGERMVWGLLGWARCWGSEETGPVFPVFGVWGLFSWCGAGCGRAPLCCLWGVGVVVWFGF
jgi:hypothetical protein